MIINILKEKSSLFKNKIIIFVFQILKDFFLNFFFLKKNKEKQINKKRLGNKSSKEESMEMGEARQTHSSSLHNYL